jgi:Zn-dependent protease with chaperone function
MQEILQAFDGEIQPVKRTLGYAFGTLILSLAMLILPALYLGMIAGIAYMLFLHATTSLGSGSPIRGIWSLFFLYVGPLVAGVILLFFMVKPIFARRSRSRPLRTLQFGEEPILFALVTRIAKAVRAPEPKRIVLDCQANASAGYGSTMGVLFGGDLVLTIGLPLAAGMSIQQLAGVIAHELGHFSQGTGMKLSFVIRSVNAWFARIVFERDDWDESLARGADREDRFALLLLFAMLCIWITRRVMWVLMIIGHCLSCFMLRRMEYDADRYEVRLAGSDAFKDTTSRVIQLGLASELAYGMADNCWKTKGQLPNDLPELVAAVRDRIPQAQMRAIEAEMLKSKSGLFDTHPAYGERVESARKEKAAGIFHIEGPATQLFKAFPKLSREVTMRFYREVLGSQATHKTLIPTAAALAGGEDTRVNPILR